MLRRRLLWLRQRRRRDGAETVSAVEGLTKYKLHQQVHHRARVWVFAEFATQTPDAELEHVPGGVQGPERRIVVESIYGRRNVRCRWEQVMGIGGLGSLWGRRGEPSVGLLVRCGGDRVEGGGRVGQVRMHIGVCPRGRCGEVGGAGEGPLRRTLHQSLVIPAGREGSFSLTMDEESGGP
jgi:hypothetical protein